MNQGWQQQNPYQNYQNNQYSQPGQTGWANQQPINGSEWVLPNNGQIPQYQASNQYQMQSNNGWQSQQYNPTQPSTDSWKQHTGWGGDKSSIKAMENNYVPPPSVPSNTPLVTPETAKPLFEPGKTYNIVTALSSTMVMDVSQENMSQNRLLLWKANGQANQKFVIRPAADGKYQIFCENLGLALGVESGSRAIGSYIVASQPGEYFQLFDIIDAKSGDGGVFIQTFCGKCLDLSEWKTDNGSEIFQYNFNNGKNQMWYLKPVWSYMRIVTVVI